jgi:riboflavin biosynthesis pyrimidine reductase
MVDQPLDTSTKPLVTLYERGPIPAPPVLPEPLRQLYGGDLSFPRLRDRPYVVGNFVETLDGVVSYGLPGRSGGGEISRFDQADQFLMGLLRSCSDAVMVASGTLHGDSGHVRTPSFIFPVAAALYAGFRRDTLNKPGDPLNVVVSGSGRIDLAEPTFHTPGLQTLIVTTANGERKLRADHGPRLGATQVRVVGGGGAVPPGAILDLLWREFGVRLLLHEGGPRLLGAFLAARLLDELFLTVAPQVAGRDDAQRRRAFVEGTAFTPETAPWFALLSVKRAGDYLFLRVSARA